MQQLPFSCSSRFLITHWMLNPLLHFSYLYCKLVKLWCLPFSLFCQSHKGQLQQQTESLSAGCGGLRSNSWVLLFLLRHRLTARPLFEDSSPSVSINLSWNFSRSHFLSIAVPPRHDPYSSFSEPLTDFSSTTHSLNIFSVHQQDLLFPWILFSIKSLDFLLLRLPHTSFSVLISMNIIYHPPLLFFPPPHFPLTHFLYTRDDYQHSFWVISQCFITQHLTKDWLKCQGK